MAAILNRTLIVPPVLDHHAVALGSCPKFRVLSPSDLRLKVWNHAVELIKEGRYISMAEIIDLSSIANLVRTIDLRDFVSLWCNVALDSVCLDGSNVKSSWLDNLRQCGSLLSGLGGNVYKCVYAVDEDCRTTVWTYKSKDVDGALDAFQPDEQARLKKKISYVRHRRDVYKNLGPGSAAHLSTVLAFGSLFTSPYRGSQLYIDIRESPRDNRIQSLLDKIECMPFVPEITNAAKEFVQKVIKSPYVCAQLRLLDGQFKNHWKTTFSVLKLKLQDLKQKGALPVHIFLMTDLPRSNWSGSYLEELAGDESSFKLHVLNNDDEFVRRTAGKIAPASCGRGGTPDNCLRPCPHQLPDVLLYLEETVCSCASLGFVGTAGSTIAESIELMRKNSVCLEQKQTS